MGLALEAPQRYPVAKHVAEHNLDRNPAIETQICSFVDRSHPTPADQLFQAIFHVNRSFDGQAQGQLALIFGADIARAVVTSAARRALFDQIDLLLFKTREHFVFDLLLFGRLLLEPDIFINDSHLRRNGLQQLTIIRRVRLFGLLFAQQEQTCEPPVGAAHRHNQIDAELAEPGGFVSRQTALRRQRKIPRFTLALHQAEQF